MELDWLPLGLVPLRHTHGIGNRKADSSHKLKQLNAREPFGQRTDPYRSVTAPGERIQPELRDVPSIRLTTLEGTLGPSNPVSLSRLTHPTTLKRP